MESRMETYLNAAISGNTENLPKPISRIDFLLCELIKTLGESGASIEEVERIVSDKVAEIVASAPEDLNTLKEISDWIYTHEESAAAMNTAIQTNANSIKSLLTDVNKKANSDNVYDKATADSRFLGIDATADKAVADENGSNISETFSDVKNDIVINRTTLGTQCKNLLDVRNYARKYTAGVTASPNGVDGLTFSGTANNTFYLAWDDKAFSLKKGDYILSYAGDITSDKPNNTFLRVRKSDNTIICDLPLSQTSKSFSLNADDELYFITVYTNVTANVQGTIKPMLRYADITDDTYEPYKESVDERLIQNESDIALNRTTLGTQCKNLFNPNAVNWFQPTKTSIAKDGTITSTTTSDSRNWGYENAEYFLTLSAGKYIVSTVTETIDNTASKFMNIRGYNESGTELFSIYPNNIGTKTISFTLTETATIAIMFKLFTQTCKIMIRDADILDDTYEPYKESVDERLIQNKSDIAVNKTTLGTQCKNLLKNNAVTQTVSGVTFTINDDKSITVNGTATAQISFLISREVGLGIGNYILTGCPSGGSQNTFYLTAYASSAWLKSPDFGSGCRIENKTVTHVVISIASGYTANNLKFYPMLRYADITDDTYEPYKPSLQDQITALEARIAALEV